MQKTYSSHIASTIRKVDPLRLRRDLFYLAKDPLPFRKVNFTLPGHTLHTLDETDLFIQARLEALGYGVEREACQAQAFRCDPAKPLHHWYSPPRPEDAWYTLHNLYAKKAGQTHPDEIVLLVSHKDSPSWYPSPGAYDNAVGAAANLEIARLLQSINIHRSVWFLFCNEEHWPWTSVTAAEQAKQRGDNLVAVINLDSLGGKSQASVEAGRYTNITRYCTQEGKPLADLMDWVNLTYAIGLQQSAYAWDQTGDDDGSFIKAGYPAAIMNLGSFPYDDPNYHLEGDTPENVDLENVARATQACLAAVLHSAGWIER
jgi:hypothetical protein